MWIPFAVTGLPAACKKTHYLTIMHLKNWVVVAVKVFHELFKNFKICSIKKDFWQKSSGCSLIQLKNARHTEWSNGFKSLVWMYCCKSVGAFFVTRHRQVHNAGCVLLKIWKTNNLKVILFSNYIVTLLWFELVFL